MLNYYIVGMTRAICDNLRGDMTRYEREMVVQAALKDYWRDKHAFVLDAEDVETVLTKHISRGSFDFADIRAVLDRVAACVDGDIPHEDLIFGCYNEELADRQRGDGFEN